MAKFTTFEVPQESKKTDFDKVIADKNSFETPPALFRAISDYFGGFNLDAAATSENTKVPELEHPICGREIHPLNRRCDDGLSESWLSDTWMPEEQLYHFERIKSRVWCNPPYENGSPYRWAHKAFRETILLGNAELSVLLLPFDPSTQLWRHFNPIDGELHRADVYLLDKRRIRFIGRWVKPDGTLSGNTVSRGVHMLMVFKEGKDESGAC